MKAIFTFNTDGALIIDRPEVLTIASFKAILDRDKNTGGSYKAMAYKELAYVWLLGHPASPIYTKGLSGKDAHSFAKAKVGLPNDWKVDAVIEQAIKDYKECNADIFDDVVEDLIITFKYYSKVIKKVRKSIEQQLDRTEALTKDQSEQLVGLMTTILNISKIIPKEILSLKEVLVQLQESKIKDDRDMIRGTEEYVPDSADPDKDW